MPPFGNEPAESEEKPLPFLALGQRVKPDPKLQSTVFGAEGPEQSRSSFALKSKAGSRARARLPFQDEDAEPEAGPLQKAARLAQPSRPAAPFADEYEEGDVQRAPSDSDEGSDGDYGGTAETVFSFGWAAMSSFKRGSFWKDHSDDKAAAPAKRKYDNTKRSAEAAYTRRGSKGVFERSGVDPSRLDGLLNRDSCQCASATPSLCISFCLRRNPVHEVPARSASSSSRARRIYLPFSKASMP